MRKSILNTGLVLVLILGFVSLGFAAEEKKGEAREMAVQDGKDVVIKTDKKEITGEVSAISKNFIAIVYKKDANTEIEMGLFIEGLPKLERIKNFSQIEAGATVTVQYDEVTEQDVEGKERARRVAKKIIFVRPPPAQLQITEPEQPEERETQAALQSG